MDGKLSLFGMDADSSDPIDGTDNKQNSTKQYIYENAQAPKGHLA